MKQIGRRKAISLWGQGVSGRKGHWFEFALALIAALLLAAACRPQPVALAPSKGGASPLATPPSIVSPTRDAASPLATASPAPTASPSPTPQLTPTAPTFSLTADPDEPTMGVLWTRITGSEYRLRVPLADWRLNDHLLEHRELEGCRIHLASFPHGGPESPVEFSDTTLGEIWWGIQHWPAAKFLAYTPAVGGEWDLMFNVLYEAERGSAEFSRCIAAAEQVLTTSEPAATSLLPTLTPTPIVLLVEGAPNDSETLTIQANSRSGLSPYLLTVPLAEWQLTDTHLEHRTLVGCHLHPLQWPFQWMEQQMQTRSALIADVQWSIDYIAWGKQFDYNADLGKGPILIGVTHTVDQESPEFAACVAAAEEVIATARLP